MEVGLGCGADDLENFCSGWPCRLKHPLQSDRASVSYRVTSTLRRIKDLNAAIRTQIKQCYLHILAAVVFNSELEVLALTKTQVHFLKRCRFLPFYLKTIVCQP